VSSPNPAAPGPRRVSFHLLFKNFSLKRYIGSRQTADLTHFLAVVDNGNVIFAQPIGISRLAITIYSRENTSLHGIERAYAVGLHVFDEPLTVNHHIVVDNENDFALCETQAAVDRTIYLPCSG
jgi:hypothetical protein